MGQASRLATTCKDLCGEAVSDRTPPPPDGVAPSLGRPLSGSHSLPMIPALGISMMLAGSCGNHNSCFCCKSYVQIQSIASFLLVQVQGSMLAALGCTQAVLPVVKAAMLFNTALISDTRCRCRCSTLITSAASHLRSADSTRPDTSCPCRCTMRSTRLAGSCGSGECPAAPWAALPALRAWGPACCMAACATQ